jgi:hypothetical protein
VSRRSTNALLQPRANLRELLRSQFVDRASQTPAGGHGHVQGSFLGHRLDGEGDVFVPLGYGFIGLAGRSEAFEESW